MLTWRRFWRWCGGLVFYDSTLVCFVFGHEAALYALSLHSFPLKAKRESSPKALSRPVLTYLLRIAIAAKLFCSFWIIIFFH
jgi:hypothetical protein